MHSDLVRCALVGTKSHDVGLPLLLVNKNNPALNCPECPGNLQTAVLREIPAVDPLHHAAAAAACKNVIWFRGPTPACPTCIYF